VRTWALGGLALVAALGAARVGAARDDRGWLGVYTEPVAALPVIEERAGGAGALRGARCGLRVTAVLPDSPAEIGGLLLGDLLIGVGGRPFTCPPESVSAVFRGALEGRRAGESCSLRVVRDAVASEVRRDGAAVSDSLQASFWRNAQAAVDSLRSGQALEARAARQQEVRDLPIVLGPRPEARWPEPRPNAEIFPPDRFPPSAWTARAWALADSCGVRADTEDLLARLARCHAGADPQRLDCMVYVHRDPFRLESMACRIADDYARAPDVAARIARSASWLAAGRPPAAVSRAALAAPPALPAGTRAQRLEPLLAQITAVLAEATREHARAFAAVTPEERAFLESARWDLSDVFAADIYIHFDDDRERFRRNQRLIEIASRVDYDALLRAAAVLARLTDPAWARAAADAARAVYADTLDAEILCDRATPAGRILIGGTSRHWYRDLDAAFILDLGGDDFYTGNSGGSQGWALPVAVCIDAAGDDAYESTLKSCQGTGCLGVGGLLDLSGDDQYLGLQWCQGTGYFGVGWLQDLAGDDTYRGRTFCQGVGLFGLGLLLDEAGDDRYEGDCHVQGVGLPRGIGALVDAAGDDAYYAKGLYPTNYGDAGIFDAWSQGCGTGFRTVASGGLGLLVDGAGRDRMEAGNFSQGGGYYYAIGILQARGPEDDVYIGSRYDQGFAAHQAVGAFLEEGGDDRYLTRQGVAQGLAWDECVTLFRDAAGDDAYQGGGFFSQGASAHNSFCFFLDHGGRDRYDYAPGPARAGGNDYHGGTSFSLFVDEGGAPDGYTAASAGNDTTACRPEHGFFLDLPGRIGDAEAAPPGRR
jgi:hypothetical protein